MRKYNEDNPMPKEDIRKINDLMRTTMLRSPSRRIVMTQGVLLSPYCEEIVTAIREMPDNYFDEDNDPHQEHDFGMVEVAGEKWYFKIDYYDESLERFGFHTFVMTIMNSREY